MSIICLGTKPVLMVHPDKCSHCKLIVGLDTGTWIYVATERIFGDEGRVSASPSALRRKVEDSIAEGSVTS